MPKPPRPVDVVNQAAKSSVAVGHFKITKVQGEEIKRIEREQGHDQALRRVLEVLRSR